jgi:murein endopeptidase
VRRWKLVACTLGATVITIAGAALAARATLPRPASLEREIGAPHIAIPEPAALAAPAEPELPKRCPPEPLLTTRLVEPPPQVELVRLMREDPARLGSASIGSPTRGRLFGAVQLGDSDGITTEGDHLWGTEVAVRSIERAVREVRRCHPDTPKLHVGDISRRQGGWLRPHRSHQSGLDADIGYYYTDGPAWFQHATAANLDRRRTWALIRALVEGGSVDMIFIDRSVQQLLLEHVEREDPAGAELFAAKPRDGVIRHASGHGAHFHVRFRDPASVDLGARIAPLVNAGYGVQRQSRPAQKPRKTFPRASTKRR